MIPVDTPPRDDILSSTPPTPLPPLLSAEPTSLIKSFMVLRFTFSPPFRNDDTSFSFCTTLPYSEIKLGLKLVS